jgi:GNAT superfamily N-acetyltransferase
VAEIRRAGPQDARRIAEIHVASWRAAYKGLVQDEVLDGLSVERREDGWKKRLSEASSRGSVLAAVEEGRVVGFASAGPPQEEDDAGNGSTGELYAIYLEPRAWGRGIGRALLAETASRLRADGFADAILWVVEGNDRTRRFYELAGWRADGGYKTECMPGVDAPAVRYRVKL